MGFQRIYPTKDTFVTNYKINDVSMTSSNCGASEILQLFKIHSDPQSGSMAHILTQFDTSQISQRALSAETASYYLKFFDAQHDSTLPAGYAIEIIPQTQAWTEGPGHDIDSFGDSYVSNWLTASAGQPWANAGAVPSSTSTIKSFAFDNGHEDVFVDVSSIVRDWIASGSNYGLFIRISSSLEADDQDYYIKEFHSRQTHFPQKKPYIEARWNDFTGSLSSGSTTLVNPTGTLQTSLYNLKSVYSSIESTTLRLYALPFFYDVATSPTASSETPGSVFTASYYQIVDDLTDEVVVPFGTGSEQHTRMSYDDSGNYFRLDMSSLPTGSSYRIEIMFTSGTDVTVIPGDANKFRIR